MNFVYPEIVNVVENKKVTFSEYPNEGITFEEPLKKIENHEEILQGTSIVLPWYNDSEAIWIADDVEDAWWKATHEEMLSGFELNAFVEWT